MSACLSKTPLHDWHVARGARMVDFAGWSMPVQYTSIVDEHLATRRHVTLFDISHMGRLRLTGHDAATFVDGLTTRRVLDMKHRRIRYSLLTNDAGGILDDILVYAPGANAELPEWAIVVNAGNREKIVGWIEQHLHRNPERDVSFQDDSADTAMIAVQGPRAWDAARVLFGDTVAGMKYYTWQRLRHCDSDLTISRTGYTGEDGLEIICPAELGVTLWDQLLTIGHPHGIQPAGLGARDTLRLEAGMPLYGHELTEDIDPFQAGLDYAVDLAAERQFVGSDALREIQRRGPSRVRVGLELAGKRVPREHYAVVADGETVGEITSGTFSPTFDRPLAMAYVPPTHSAVDTAVGVDIRGRLEPARVVPLPFYRRA